MTTAHTSRRYTSNGKRTKIITLKMPYYSVLLEARRMQKVKGDFHAEAFIIAKAAGMSAATIRRMCLSDYVRLQAALLRIFILP